VVTLKKVRVAIIVILVVGLAVAGYAGYRLFTEEPDHEPPISRSTGTTEDGWKQVTYRGVDLEVPGEWERLDATGCTEDVEHWGPADLDPCAADRGLWFLESATFDPPTGPGVHSVPVSISLPAGGWGGYVTRGKVVVDVADDDQAVARRILQSVSQVL
jgi:hypothetical protein